MFDKSKVILLHSMTKSNYSRIRRYLRKIQKGGYDPKTIEKYARSEAGWLGLIEVAKTAKNTQANQEKQRRDEALYNQVFAGRPGLESQFPEPGQEYRFLSNSSLLSSSYLQWKLYDDQSSFLTGLNTLVEQTRTSGFTGFQQQFKTMFLGAPTPYIALPQNGQLGLYRKLYDSTFGASNTTRGDIGLLFQTYHLMNEIVTSLQSLQEKFNAWDNTTSDAVYQWLQEPMDQTFRYKYDILMKRLDESMSKNIIQLDTPQYMDFQSIKNRLTKTVMDKWTQPKAVQQQQSMGYGMSPQQPSMPITFLYVPEIAQMQQMPVHPAQLQPQQGYQQPQYIQSKPVTNQDRRNLYKERYPLLFPTLESERSSLSKDVQGFANSLGLIREQIFGVMVSGMFSVMFGIFGAVQDKKFQSIFQWNQKYWLYLYQMWKRVSMYPTEDIAYNSNQTHSDYIANVEYDPNTKVVWGWGGVMSMNKLTSLLPSSQQTLQASQSLEQSNLSCSNASSTKQTMQVYADTIKLATDTMKYAQPRLPQFSEQEWLDKTNEQFKSLEETIPKYINDFGCLRQALEQRIQSIPANEPMKRRSAMGEYLLVKCFFEKFYRLGASTEEARRREKAYGMNYDINPSKDGKAPPTYIGHWSPMGIFVFDSYAKSLKPVPSIYREVSTFMKGTRTWPSNSWPMARTPSTSFLDWGMLSQGKVLPLIPMLNQAQIAITSTELWSLRDPSVDVERGTFWRTIWEEAKWMNKGANAPNTRVIFPVQIVNDVYFMDAWSIVSAPNPRIWGVLNLGTRQVMVAPEAKDTEIVFMNSHVMRVMDRAMDWKAAWEKVMATPNMKKKRIPEQIMAVSSVEWRRLMWDALFNLLEWNDMGSPQALLGSVALKYLTKLPITASVADPTNALWTALQNEWMAGTALTLPEVPNELVSETAATPSK